MNEEYFYRELAAKLRKYLAQYSESREVGGLIGENLAIECAKGLIAFLKTNPRAYLAFERWGDDTYYYAPEYGFVSPWETILLFLAKEHKVEFSALMVLVWVDKDIKAGRKPFCARSIINGLATQYLLPRDYAKDMWIEYLKQVCIPNLNEDLVQKKQQYHLDLMASNSLRNGFNGTFR